MNKPKITDRTKLYVGLFKHATYGSFALSITFNNSGRVFNCDYQWPWLRDAEGIRCEECVFQPVDCPLTLVKLAGLIRKTKVLRLDYTAFVKAQAAIDKAQAIAIRTNNRYFKEIPF